MPSEKHDSNPPLEIHNIEINLNGVKDQETINFARDLRSVWSCTLQNMPILGPWLEEYVRSLIQSWTPNAVMANGQIYRQEQLELRSRSWDIILCKHSSLEVSFPAAASSNSAPPLVSLSDAVAVIDTKTNFLDVTKYASQPVFNWLNDATMPQLEFLGERLPKIIFACSTSGNPAALEEKGRELGIFVFVLGRYIAESVDRGSERKIVWELFRGVDDVPPLQRFRELIQKISVE